MASSVTFTNVAAQVPLGDDDTLPVGWHWWDRGISSSSETTRWQTAATWVTDQPDAQHWVHERERWSRTLNTAAIAERAVDAWLSDRDGQRALNDDRDAVALVAGEDDRLQRSSQASVLLTGGTPDEPLNAGQVIGILQGQTRDWALSRLGYGYHNASSRSHPPAASTTVSVHMPPSDSDRWTHWPERWLMLPGTAGTRAEYGQVYVLPRRVARAAQGTTIPTGWRQVTDPDPKLPWMLSKDEAVELADVQFGGPPSELTTVTLRRQPSGRWSYGVGTGGHLRVRGETDRQDQAEAAGRQALAADQERAWADMAARAGAEMLAGSAWGPVPPPAVVVVIDPVGALEIADRLGVARQTVDNWRQRDDVDFPDSDYVVGGRPAWDWDTVREWAQRTGRAT